MKVIADFHTHPRFAMECGPSIATRGMETAALGKGISLMDASNARQEEATQLYGKEH